MPMKRLLSKHNKLDGLRVLVRLDLDLPEEDGKLDTTRLDNSISTIKHLLLKGAAHVEIIGHRGRPQGKKVRALSLKPIEEILRSKLTAKQQEFVTVRENLRYDTGEEKNTITFAKSLAKGFNLYVNDAFGASHREHASIVQVPKLLPTVYGLHFEQELAGLKPLIKNAKRPFILIMGGAKLETKLPMIGILKSKVDVILVGGKLALELEERPIENRKLIIGQLTEDKLDITQDTVDQFARFIAAGKTILWNGPLGKIEDENARAGTRAIAKHLASCRGYVVAGGGDTEAALSLLRIRKGISFVSSGGGALLEYVAHDTLPGIDAVEASPEL